MPDSRPATRPSRLTLAALCLALIGAASIAYYHLHFFVPRVMEVRQERGLGNGYSFGDDFYPIWLTTRATQAGQRDLYTAAMTQRIQIGLFGRPLEARYPNDPPVDYRTFAYPAAADLLFWPCAALDFPTLRLVLVVLLPLLTAASVWLWLLALDWRIHPLWIAVIIPLALCNYPVLEGIFALQPGLIAGFLLAAAALAIRRGLWLLAGALMSLTWIKPQMTLLLTLYLLLWSVTQKSRARVWIGFLITSVPWLALSLWIWPHWLGQWIHVLLGYHRYATPTLVNLLPGETLGKFLGPLAVAILLALAAMVAWRHRNAEPASPDFWLTVSLLLAISSVVLLPGQAIYDHVILLPGILFLLCYRRELWHAGRIPRNLTAVCAAVLFWTWPAALGLLIVRPFLTRAVFYSLRVSALPFCTAASLPFAVLAMLACAAKFNVAKSPELR